jgi:hypothetical protein
MIWENKEIKTYGDIIDVMSAIYDKKDKEAAQHFMELYREDNPEGADSNIGYLTGYMDPVTMKEMQELFGVKHPIFSSSIPTPEEAFKMGSEL